MQLLLCGWSSTNFSSFISLVDDALKQEPEPEQVSIRRQWSLNANPSIESLRDTQRPNWNKPKQNRIQLLSYYLERIDYTQ